MRSRQVSSRESCHLTRREILKLGLGVAGASALGELALPGVARADGPPPTPIAFTPFTRPLPIPGNGISVLQPVAPFPTSWQFAPGAEPKFYTVTAKRAAVEILPGVQTEIFGYNGEYPGPAILGRMGTPDLVRHVNALDVEASVHQHGGHNPSDSDGLPVPDQLIFPGKYKDYWYPNEPVTLRGAPDPNDNPSTLWYHDHATDITGPNVYAGLAAFYLYSDSVDDGLVYKGTGSPPFLPSQDGDVLLDVPLVLQDRRFNADGSLFYSPFQHDGFLGDVYVVNGKAQPFFRVQRRKYRFRILNGANARVFMLRFSNGTPFLQVGADSWLLPFAIPRGDRILLGMAERVDVVVDFRNAPDEVFLENILVQDSGRGPGGDIANPDVRIPGTPLVKFLVEGSPVPNDATVRAGTPLRPHTPIRPSEIVATRSFEWNRSQGAWQVNGRFYDENRADATPRIGTAERWILKNGGGGWWHPVHIHLECHQVQRFNGRAPPVYNSFKKDTTLLGPGDEAEVFIRFRDHPGRFVAHCHNLEHEDDRMMIRYDVVSS